MYRMDGSEAGSIDLNDAVFNVDVNPTMVHDVVVALRNNKRQGNHETKTRTDVGGRRQKPYKQRAPAVCHGSTREPLMRGGGVVARTPGYRRKSPCSGKALANVERPWNDQLCVLEALEYAQPKTKPFAQLVGKLSPKGRKTLVVTATTDKNALLSARNVPRVTLITASDLNALDVLGAQRVVVLKDAIAKLEERLA